MLTRLYTINHNTSPTHFTNRIDPNDDDYIPGNWNQRGLWADGVGVCVNTVMDEMAEGQCNVC